MNRPRIHLVIDNCFASKRWTKPREWLSIARELSLAYVEASADTECDPLYTDPEYLEEWIREVQSACEETDVTVVNLYSGHGTYTSLGLGSPDPRNQVLIRDQWLKVMTGNASRLGAGLGFFCHAFDHQTLQDPLRFQRAEEMLVGHLAELAGYARSCGLKTIGVEQMYSPHQIPWTINGARWLLRAVHAQGGAPFYLTIDTGHQVGQRKFLRPTRSRLSESMRYFRTNRRIERGIWLGPDSAYKILSEGAAAPAMQEDVFLDRVEQEINRYPYLFASFEDGDPYAWLAQLACYSPIIHLQQTDGMASSHNPFTQDHHRTGVIQAGKVLNAIAAAYASRQEPGMPPRCEDLYLTLEIFAGTAALPADILHDLKESVSYWRKYVPCDGLDLGELLHQGKASGLPDL
jgi:sugar phosphate isomerase/epimerase